jgi:hypothetical protein
VKTIRLVAAGLGLALPLILPLTTPASAALPNGFVCEGLTGQTMQYFNHDPALGGATFQAPTIGTVSGGWKRTSGLNSVNCTTPVTILPLTAQTPFIEGPWNTLGGGCLLMSMGNWGTHQAVEVGMTALVTTDELTHVHFLAESDVFVGAIPCFNETSAVAEFANLQ